MFPSCGSSKPRHEAYGGMPLSAIFKHGVARGGNFVLFLFGKAGSYHRMSPQKYEMIAIGWGMIVVFLAVFWWLMLSRLAQVLKERLKDSRMKREITGFGSLFQFVIRGEFRETKDDRLISVCRKLRQLLYGYLGIVAAYIVFLEIYRPRF